MHAARVHRRATFETGLRRIDRPGGAGRRSRAAERHRRLRASRQCHGRAPCRTDRARQFLENGRHARRMVAAIARRDDPRAHPRRRGRPRPCGAHAPHGGSG